MPKGSLSLKAPEGTSCANRAPARLGNYELLVSQNGSRAGWSEKVAPKEVGNALVDIDGVLEAAVIGVPGEHRSRNWPQLRGLDRERSGGAAWAALHRRLDGPHLGCLEHYRGAVVLGDNVWVAYGAIIDPGVHVGNGSVISAGSVVTTDVPPNMLALENPARRLPLELLQRNPRAARRASKRTPCSG